MRRKNPWITTALAGVLAVAAPASASEGQAPSVEDLQKRMDAMEKRHAEEVQALKEQLDRLQTGGGLEAVLEETLERLDKVEQRFDTELPVAADGGPGGRWMEISLLSLFTVGGSTASEAELESFQAGGHDPKKRGFTNQNVELAISGAIDPWLRGDANIIFQVDAEGETVVELEEAYLTTTSLPAGLQVRAGQFFTEIGRANAQHPHTWSFVDRPVIHSRLFGPDGMRAPGASVSWLAPTGIPLEVTGAVQNANGETMVSFISTDEEELPAGRIHAGRDVRSGEELVYTGRLATTHDLDETTTILAGLSGAAGPNASGPTGRTRILGADLYLKWRPVDAEGGFPFVSWQTEVYQRRYHADRLLDPVEGFFPHETLTDRGAYSQVVYGFARDWTVGFRYDRAHGSHDDSHLDAMRDRRTRGSVAVTWFPSEFSRIRLQVNHERSEALGKALSVWLQFEFNLGSHGAHVF